MSRALCDIIIPIFNKKDLTRDCLESIIKKTHTDFNLILIDNNSDEDTAKFLENFKFNHDKVLLIRNKENVGWVKAVNQGITSAAAPYICIMNNDTIIKTDDWLSCLMNVAESSPDIGLVNPNFDLKSNKPGRSAFTEVDFCRGYCILAKRAVIDKIGGLDEAYGLGYYDDDDFSVRAIRAGFRCVKANNCYVEHLRDSTFSAIFKDDKRRALHEKNKNLFYSKWGRRLKVVFAIKGSVDRNALSKLLLELARQQHIIYIWSSMCLPDTEHINIRRKALIPIFGKIFFFAGIYLNSRKKISKRFDMIFTDDANIFSRLSRMGINVKLSDVVKDAEEIKKDVSLKARA